jgi:uncharacterized protein (TIGR02217 family)
MSFINFPTPTPVFPALPVQGWSVNKKPIMASRATVSVRGTETRLACAVYPRWAFTLTFGGDSWLRDATQNSVPDPTLAGLTELQQISGLFLQCRGSYGEFYFSDPEDNSRLEQIVSSGNGTQVLFPLTYSWGNGPFTPGMTIPVGGINTITAVYVTNSAGVPILQDPTRYSIDSTNTALVFTTAPVNGRIITATFSFYFRCRFLDDTLTFSQFAQNLWELKTMQFESVKP